MSQTLARFAASGLSWLAAGALAFVFAGSGGVAPGDSGGAEPRVPGAAGGAVLLQAGLALAALRCGRALAVRQMPRLDIAMSHDDVRPVNPDREGIHPAGCPAHEAGADRQGLDA